VTVGAHLAEQLVRLAPGRLQRQPDDVLVECPGLLEVLGDVRRVMQPGGTPGHRGVLLCGFALAHAASRAAVDASVQAGATAVKQNPARPCRRSRDMYAPC